MRKILAALLTALLLVAYIQNMNSIDPELKEYSIITASVGGKSFKLFVADTQSKQSKGLSGVSNLESDQGMLFMFDVKSYRQFWMKDMKLSLDILFIDNVTIVDIKRNITPESYPNKFVGSKPYDKVIELQSGVSSSIKIGEKIVFK